MFTIIQNFAFFLYNYDDCYSVLFLCAWCLMFLLVSAHQDGTGRVVHDVVAHTTHHGPPDLAHASCSCYNETRLLLISKINNGLTRLHIGVQTNGDELSLNPVFIQLPYKLGLKSVQLLVTFFYHLRHSARTHHGHIGEGLGTVGGEHTILRPVKVLHVPFESPLRLDTIVHAQNY